MTWTKPIDKVAGDIVLASDPNTIQANAEAVKGGAAATVPEIDLDELGEAGIANSILVTKEYLFAAGNILDYTATVNGAGFEETITYSELPATTRAIWVQFAITGSSIELALGIVWDFPSCRMYSVYQDGDTGDCEYSNFQWIPTNAGNTMRHLGHAGTISAFKIWGYKVIEA